MRSSVRINGVFYWPVLLVLLVCSSAAALVAASDEGYLPLRQGDEWTMDVLIISPAGEKFTATGHRKVGEKTERDGKTYYQVRTWLENGPFPLDQIKLIRKDATGVYSIDPQWKDQKEQTEIVLPLKVGQSWKRSNGPQTLNERVVGLETVTIGEKVFEKCYHIRSEAGDGRFTEDY